MRIATVIAMGVAIATPSLSTNANAEYLIMHRTPTTHVVLMNARCPSEPMFASKHNEKVGYIVDGEQKTSGCWYKEKGEIYFTFQASGGIIVYPANKFYYVGPNAYYKKYGQIQ